MIGTTFEAFEASKLFLSSRTPPHDVNPQDRKPQTSGDGADLGKARADAVFESTLTLREDVRPRGKVQIRVLGIRRELAGTTTT